MSVELKRLSSKWRFSKTSTTTTIVYCVKWYLYIAPYIQCMAHNVSPLHVILLLYTMQYVYHDLMFYKDCSIMLPC